MQQMYSPIPDQNAGLNADTAQLLSTSCDAAWIWEPPTDLFHWIHGADTFANASHTGLASWTNNIHPDDREETLSCLLAAGNSAFPWQRQYRYQQTDGSWQLVVCRAGIQSAAGQPVRVLASMLVIPDPSFGNPASPEIAAHKATLEVELLRANAQLEEANTNLQQTNAELEQFAYIASHDLQEPLRKIAVFSNMLTKMRDLSPDALSTAERINAASTRMSSLIRDLLDFSRLIKVERIMRPVNLNKVMEAVLGDFELQRKETGAAITCDYLPTIEAIGLQMNQLFYNLISNSLKFVKEGVVPRIEVHCRVLGSDGVTVHGLPGEENKLVNYFITFSDNGIGFNSLYADQIFEVFKRLHSRHVYPGTGIGLALCKRIVQNHQGIMTALSEEGAGTVISIILPSRQTLE